MSGAGQDTSVRRVGLPEALYNQIEELAKATARSKSFLAIDALTHYLQTESWQRSGLLMTSQ